MMTLLYHVVVTKKFVAIYLVKSAMYFERSTFLKAFSVQYIHSCLKITFDIMGFTKKTTSHILSQGKRAKLVIHFPPPDFCGESAIKQMKYVANHITLSGMTCESKKNAHLQSPLGATFIKLNELGRVSKKPD